MDRLPSDLKTNILSRLPVRSVFLCRSVCKPWCSLIDNPHFIQTHIQRTCSISVPVNDTNTTTSPIILLPHKKFRGVLNVFQQHDNNPNPIPPSSSMITISLPSSTPYLTKVGLSKGLICFTRQLSCRHVLTYVYNPSIGEFVSLPELHLCKTSDTNTRLNFVQSGFGYVPSTGQLKVVHIVPFVEHVEEEKVITSRVYLYTLGSADSSWTMLGLGPDEYLPLHFSQGMGDGPLVLLNRSLHSIAFTDGVNIPFRMIILSFDLKREEFRFVPAPNYLFRSTPVCDEAVYYRLEELGGCLSILDCTLGDVYEIWIMKDHYVGESWTKQLVITRNLISQTCMIQPVCFRKNGEIVFLCGCNTLVSYNSETKRLTKLEDAGRLEWDSMDGDSCLQFEAFQYTATFLSPKSICSRDEC